MTATTLSAKDVPVYSRETATSTKRLWASRIMGALPALFLLVDGAMKLFKPTVVIESSAQLGYPETTLVGIGIALLVSTLLYAVPRTSILGAILLSGYLGGAVATHVRVSGPAFNIIFPVIFGSLLWGSLWLRERRLQQLLPLRAN